MKQYAQTGLEVHRLCRGVMAAEPPDGAVHPGASVYRHIMWFFGPVRMRDIGPAQVREWITAVTARGVSARRIAYAKNSVLGAVFTTALEDGVIAAHPGHRVATDPVPRKPRRILTPTPRTPGRQTACDQHRYLAILRQRSWSMDRQCPMSITVTRTRRCLNCRAGTRPDSTPLTLRN
jgi:hypothetical protein